MHAPLPREHVFGGQIPFLLLQTSEITHWTLYFHCT